MRDYGTLAVFVLLVAGAATFGALFQPYVARVSFAADLNAGIWYLNRSMA